MIAALATHRERHFRRPTVPRSHLRASLSMCAPRTELRPSVEPATWPAASVQPIGSARASSGFPASKEPRRIAPGSIEHCKLKGINLFIDFFTNCLVDRPISTIFQVNGYIYLSPRLLGVLLLSRHIALSPDTSGATIGSTSLPPGTRVPTPSDTSGRPARGTRTQDMVHPDFARGDLPTANRAITLESGGLGLVPRRPINRWWTRVTPHTDLE
jgi:hypothetical protein